MADNRKDAREEAASEQLNTFQTMSEDDLLEIIKKGNLDQFYVIRSALKEKGTKEKSGPVLVRILETLDGRNFYLERYHVCETLFHIFRIKNDVRFRDIAGNLEGIDIKKKNSTLKEIKKRHKISALTK